MFPHGMSETMEYGSRSTKRHINLATRAGEKTVRLAGSAAVEHPMFTKFMGFQWLSAAVFIWFIYG